MSRIPIYVPDLGIESEEIKFGAWLLEPGQPVNAGEDLFEIEADKATVVCEAEASGVLAELTVAEGLVHQGDLLGYLEASEDAQPEAHESVTLLPDGSSRSS
jgi:pyruvate/2-oxoglutarate dehydrogenase complex dihydrolipoamide acyltransferase (E2) component